VSLQAVGRMIIAPAGVAVAVGILLRPIGMAAFLLAFASFLMAQLAWAFGQGDGSTTQSADSPRVTHGDNGFAAQADR
jgi:hypothetical protein